MSYESFVDAIYFCKPLVCLPSSIQQTLHFAYIHEVIMFISNFLGIVRCSDALDEHEAVIREVLQDSEFIQAAKEVNGPVMNECLLRVAQSHEQPWLQRLRRRRGP